MTAAVETRTPNPDQQAAIEAVGTVFVSAGAGTGKTTVLVERFLRAIAAGLDIGSILVITYTERAAGELRSRIRSRLVESGRTDLARDLDAAWISTIHGFCHRLLRAHAAAAGLDPRFRVLDEAQARVLQAEAFAAALDEFCAGGEPARLRLLATYRSSGLRRMLTGVAETLRAAGRPLELALGEEPELDARIEQLRLAARAVLEEVEHHEGVDRQRAQVCRALELVDTRPAADLLLDLSSVAVRGRGTERFSAYEDARRDLEQTALNVAASRDRDLLQELLIRFDAAYRDAKDRESALDFEDLQLRARELLETRSDIRERERLRFRSVMVDEFQDTNQLQCELIDLIAMPGPSASTASWGGAGKGGEPEGRGQYKGVRPRPERRSILPPAASGDVEAGLGPAGDDAGLGGVEQLFFVGDEFQSIYRFRHADVEVFKARRARSEDVLPLKKNYRSRPELLDVVNELFASDFGEDFLALEAAGRFPDPAQGAAVELIVTDKQSFKGTALDWRRGEARAAACRVRELVDSGEATAGEIVFLFAAGTDAEVFEEELRSVGMPTYRAAGRGYFGQQQVVDLLAYLRLLHNRYDDEALVTVLASPLVGVSNDALVLLRRAAGRRPLFVGLERGLPPDLSERDEQLFRAFQQRHARLSALMGSVGLERLIEQVVAEHDYDLAVLAQWDGRRRYANLRKLGRLARSYEELRGRDVEGFVRFVHDQDAAGAREGEAFAEEEGGDAVRLLTIHGAKGLEFRVVVVADAGRDRPPPRGEEILCLPDGRFGFKVLDPATGRRRGAFDYEAVRRSEEESEEAERRRLYYVAMTRAIDRLIISGSIDQDRAAEARTPIGWVLDRLGGVALDEVRDEPVELERGAARLLLRVNRFRPEPEATEAEKLTGDGQLTLFEADAPAPAVPAVPELPALEPLPAPPLHEPRRLSYSALATFEQCPYKYFARYVVGMREREADGVHLGALGVGSAVHEVLEALDLSAPSVPEDVLAARTDASPEEAERIRSFVEAYCNSDLARRLATLDGLRKERGFAFEHDGVVLHGFVDVLVLGEEALVVDFKTNAIEGLDPAEVVESDYRLQRLVYALACFRAGAATVEVAYQFLERPDEPVIARFTGDDVAVLEEELSAAVARIREGSFVPTPSELACADCPALDLVCAGPRLRVVAAG